jgi:hypothetical protein
MLHKFFGNPRPWHPHYYCALAIVPALLLQIVFCSSPHSDRTAGLSICAVAVLSYLIKAHNSIAVLFNVLFLFMWGVRVCVRGVPVGRAAFAEPTACDASISKTVWTWILCAPTVFAVAFDAHELPDGFPRMGGTLCFAALLLDAVEKNSTEGRFSRNPYAFASITMSWGLYVMHPTLYTIVFPFIFSYIVINAPGGFRWSENLRAARAKHDPTVAEYTLSTSPLIPLPPACYIALRRCLFRTVIKRDNKVLKDDVA